MRRKALVPFALLGLVFLVSWADASVLLPNAPDYDWYYGCSPTSAGMMIGYYDINGYAGRDYSNLVPGGRAELSTFTGGANLVNAVIASPGHIESFYSNAASPGSSDGFGQRNDDEPRDPFDFNCLADFMGTSQDTVGNTNGSTTFYYSTSGARLNDYQLSNPNRDGMYGIGEYVRYAGYDVANLYTQLTDNDFFGHNLGSGRGFTFEDFMAEVDNDRVVMLHVDGHSMFGYGYDEGASAVYLHDTWTPGRKSMTWGGSYLERGLWGVTVLELGGGHIIPEPSGVLVWALLGIAAVTFRSRRWPHFTSR